MAAWCFVGGTEELGGLPDDRTLGRMAAVLVALAVLAARAGGASFPVRWFVLAILRRGEAVVLAFLAEMGAEAPGLDAPCGFGASPADAACLAVRFRLLAAVLATLLLPAAAGSAWSRTGRLRHRGPRPAGRARRCAAAGWPRAMRRPAHDPPARSAGPVRPAPTCRSSRPRGACAAGPAGAGASLSAGRAASAAACRQKSGRGRARGRRLQPVSPFRVKRRAAFRGQSESGARFGQRA